MKFPPMKIWLYQNKRFSCSLISAKQNLFHRMWLNSTRKVDCRYVSCLTDSWRTIESGAYDKPCKHRLYDFFPSADTCSDIPAVSLPLINTFCFLSSIYKSFYRLKNANGWLKYQCILDKQIFLSYWFKVCTEFAVFVLSRLLLIQTRSDSTKTKLSRLNSKFTDPKEVLVHN